MRSLWLLPRWSVSIVFKMLPYQSFKTMRLFDMVRLGEYRGRSRLVASPSHPHFASAVSDGLFAPPDVAACPSLTPSSVPAASRFSPRPFDTIGGAETAGRPAACYSWPSDGSVVRSRLVVVIMRPLRLLAPCAPRIACRAALSYRRRLSVPAWRRRSPVSVMPAVLYRPAHRHGRRGVGRG